MSVLKKTDRIAGWLLFWEIALIIAALQAFVVAFSQPVVGISTLALCGFRLYWTSRVGDDRTPKVLKRSLELEFGLIALAGIFIVPPLLVYLVGPAIWWLYWTKSKRVAATYAATEPEKGRLKTTIEGGLPV